MGVAVLIQSFVMRNGERYCLLVNADSGVPLFYPNLFITTQVRNASLSFASMESALSSISVLLKFCDEHEIDLVERLMLGTFFQLNEIDALVDYCQFNLSSKVAANKVTNIGKVRKPRVTNETVL